MVARDHIYIHNGINAAEDTDKDPMGDTVNSRLAPKSIGTDYSYKHQVVWPNVVFFSILHLLGCWGWYIMVFGNVTWKTIFWVYWNVGFFGGEGITVGAHRFYTHRSFKAHPVTRAMFILAQTIAGQNSMFTWCRDHRLHHRYSDTDADPHNAKRGFFFSHMGWLMTKKHPLVIELGRKIDLSDLEADWMVMFQRKYYLPLFIIFSVLIPVYVSVTYFGDTILDAFLVGFVARYVTSLHLTWLVNSLAHLYGTRPYDENLQPVESWIVSMTTLGEGWHNYHHAYPWDYAAAEITMHFNFSAQLIRLFERLGLAYDLKTASPEMVANRILRTGDGTHYKLGNDEARSALTAFGPVHPLNPSYRTKSKDPDILLQGTEYLTR